MMMIAVAALVAEDVVAAVMTTMMIAVAALVAEDVEVILPVMNKDDLLLDS
ncbi:hypothetical protein F891_00114 [Acinetobacter sp. CIP 101966]|nr:hypothetical protein F891_00114 [Acinetobacter sp. CIP 101966]